MYLGFLRTTIHVDYGGLGISGSSIERPEGCITEAKAGRPDSKGKIRRKPKRHDMSLGYVQNGNWFVNWLIDDELEL